jgi:carbamoyltransferase
VAFNCVANGKIFDSAGFENVYVHPAAGDGGLSVGAAFYVWHQVLDKPRAFVMNHAYWGPGYSRDETRRAIDTSAIAHNGYSVSELSEPDLMRNTAQIIANGKILGWFQGRAEWGPRALGNRSIVADPRRADMREIINTRIKFRERFRPFAPSVLEEALDEYFVGAVPDPFMLQVYPVRPDKRAVVPAITHVDGSGRLQTVSVRSNPRYYHLIKAFGRLSGVPMLLNTSFNENEPIVLTPAQALDCFLRTSMDVLVIGRHVLERARVPAPAFGARAARVEI